MDIRAETINRMIKILDRFSRKLKIAICLPTILEKPKFKDILKDNDKEYKRIYNLCANKRRNDQETLDDEISQYHQDNYLNEELEWAVALESLIEYEGAILSLINDIRDEIEPEHNNIINNVESLKQLVSLRMNSTPKQLRARKIELRSAETLIKHLQQDIENLKNEFNDETLKHNDVVEKSEVEISELNSVIDKIKSKHHEELDHEKNQYEKILRGLIADTAEEENSFNNQLMAHRAMLDKLVEVNIEQEKNLRQLCIQTEKKYISARCAYDRDLNKLYELQESLKTQLRLINQHYTVLQNEYDVQSVLYINLKKERELAMMQAFAEQLDNFEKNRAARIIQRTWRAYHERISTKKKKKTRRNK